MYLTGFLIWTILLSGSVDSDRAREANRAYETGDYHQAETLYREILRDHPDAPQILFNLGNTLARQGRIDESMEAFERYRDQVANPEDRAPAEYNLGYLYGETGNIEEALEHFRQTLDLDPDDEDAKFNYELLKRRQQQSPPDTDQDDQQEEEPDMQPETGEQSPDPEGDQQQDDDAGMEPPPADDDATADQEQQQDLPPEVTQEQLEHARDIMNALEQIEKELIQDFKKRQHEPIDPSEKDW